MLDVTNLHTWKITPTGRDPVTTVASCARLAVHVWGTRTLRPGEVGTATAECLDGPGRLRGLRGPYRCEALRAGIYYTGEEADLGPAPRWRTRR